MFVLDVEKVNGLNISAAEGLSGIRSSNKPSDCLRKLSDEP